MDPASRVRLRWAVVAVALVAICVLIGRAALNDRGVTLTEGVIVADVVRARTTATGPVNVIESVMSRASALPRPVALYPLGQSASVALRGRDIINISTGRRYGPAICGTPPFHNYAVSHDAQVLACLDTSNDIGESSVRYVWLKHFTEATLPGSFYLNVASHDIAFGEGHDLLVLLYDPRCPFSNRYGVFPTRLVHVNLDTLRRSTGPCTAAVVPNGKSGLIVRNVSDSPKWEFLAPGRRSGWVEGRPQAVVDSDVLYLDRDSNLRSTGHVGILLRGVRFAEYWKGMSKATVSALLSPR